MPAAAYELLSMLMRYVFVALCGLILFCAWRQMRKDARAHRKEMKKLPDAGRVGEVVDLETGKRFPLTREGSIGSAGECDIVLRRRGVRRRHALFEFVEGKGLCIKPFIGRKVLMEGVPIKGTAYALHGTKVTLSKANICIRLFAGLNVPHPVSFAAPTEQEQQPWPTETEEDMLPRPFESMMAQQYAYEQPVANQPNNLPADHYAPSGYDAQGIPLPPVAPDDNDEEGIPYFSPVERHRRSDRR